MLENGLEIGDNAPTKIEIDLIDIHENIINISEISGIFEAKSFYIADTHNIDTEIKTLRKLRDLIKKNNK